VPPKQFSEPEGIERVLVCVPSGLLPTPYCRRQRLEVFAAGTAPTDEDDYYRPVSVCDATGEAVTPGQAGCAGGVSEQVFAFVPPEAIPWAREAGIALPPLPPYSTAAGRLGASLPQTAGAGQTALRLVSPVDGMVFHVSRELRLDEQALRIEALPGNAVQYVELYVDGVLIGRPGEAPYRVWWQLSAGDHEVRARALDIVGKETWSGTARVTVLLP
jgi:penicillin-binding protein 1C